MVKSHVGLAQRKTLFGAIATHDNTNCFYVSPNVDDVLECCTLLEPDCMWLSTAGYNNTDRYAPIRSDVLEYLQSYCAAAGFGVHVEEGGSAVQVQLLPSMPFSK